MVYTLFLYILITIYILSIIVKDKIHPTLQYINNIYLYKNEFGLNLAIYNASNIRINNNN